MGMKSLFALCLFSQLSCLLPNTSRIKDVLKMKRRALVHKSIKTYAHKTQRETSIFYSIQSVSLREKVLVRCSVVPDDLPRQAGAIASRSLGSVGVRLLHKAQRE